MEIIKNLQNVIDAKASYKHKTILNGGLSFSIAGLIGLIYQAYGTTPLMLGISTVSFAAGSLVALISITPFIGEAIKKTKEDKNQERKTEVETKTKEETIEKTRKNELIRDHSFSSNYVSRTIEQMNPFTTTDEEMTRKRQL